MKPDLKNCPVHTSHACVAGYLADGGFGDAESGTDLAGAQCPGVQQLQCVSYFAHGDPGCGHCWFRSKNRSAYASFGSLRTPSGVRHQNGMLSAITVERCPPWRWNAVRRQPGIVSAIAWNTQEDRDRCMEAGMNDYLTKPLYVAALTLALQRWMDQPGVGGSASAVDTAPAVNAVQDAEPALMDFERLAQFKGMRPVNPY